VAELDGVGNVTARYVYGMKVNIPEYIIKGDVTYRVITDHLGSLRLVVDQATGSIAQRMDYDEWGNVLMDSNPDFTQFEFAGGLLENQTGLTRFGVRDYDASTGRWIAKDPIGFSGGLSDLYSYVGQDPINQTDPEGLQGGFKAFASCHSRCFNKLVPGFSDLFWPLNVLSNAPYIVRPLPTPQWPGVRFIEIPNVGFKMVAPNVYRALAGLSKIVRPALAILGAYAAGVSYGCLIACLINPCSY
jgi:RHS repeat-associated protein